MLTTFAMLVNQLYQSSLCYIVCVLFNEKKPIFLYNLQYPHTLLEAGCCQTRHQRHPQDMNEETGDSHESGRPSLSCSVLLHHL